MPNDLDKLQGTWHITSLETDGAKMRASQFSDATVVIAGSRFTSLGMGQTYEGTVELGRAKKLKTFDLVFTAGPKRGTRNLGIYALDGGRWKLCLATRGDKRPERFATKKDSGLALETLERRAVARAKTPRQSSPPHPEEPEAVSSAPATELEGQWAMVSGVFDGAAMDASMVKWCTRVTRGDITTVMAGPQVMVKARFTLDASAAPRAIDYVNLAGKTKGKSQAGVFDVDGATLRICIAEPGKPRPRDFASKPGDGRALTTWHRIDR